MSDLQYDIVHASGNTFMSEAKTAEDIKNLLKLHALLYTLTETAEQSTVHLIRGVTSAHSEDYRVFNPDRGDITFILRRDATYEDDGGELAIPGEAGPAAEGGHGPRFNSWIKFRYSREIISHTGVHFVTAHPNRRDKQLKQARLMGELMNQFGQGGKLATGSGDINASLPGNKDMQAVFDNHGLTTTAKETGVNTPTHEGSRLDYIWTLDKDSRLSVPKMKVLPIGYNSDHNPVLATIQVRRKP